MKNYDVITVGSGLVDAFVRAQFEEKNNMLLFPVGTKIQVDNITFSSGGGGINTAMCFSDLGLKAGFLGKIGSKANSTIILRELQKHNVDFLGIKSKDKHTGYSIILESKKKNRTILTFKAASDNLKFSEINLGNLHTKWFYFTSMGSESFETQKKIAVFARKKGIKLAYNPSSYHTKRGAEYLKAILQNTSVLTLNKEEAKMLVKSGNLFKGLRALGPEIVCVTDGENEGAVYDGTFLYKFIPPKIQVREATGAGDIFGSSFITGLIKLEDMESAIKIAVINSATAISREHNTKRLLSWNELERIIRHNKLKMKKEEL
ncbi:MAG: carbohydrate kinase family protein [Nanoarchaeota archaeon]